MIYFYSDGSGKLKPLQCRLSNILLQSTVRKNARSILFFFVCLFEIRNRIFPTGSTPEGEPSQITPTTQATRHPRALSHFQFPLPPYFCHASCIRSVPSPVLLSCTYNLSSLWSVPSLFSCPTHIFKPRPQKGTPQHTSNPTHKLC